MANGSVRATLEQLIRQSGEGYAAISRLLGRNPAYIQQFIKRGVPRQLAEEDRRRLARHFGVSEALLGAPCTRLSPADGLSTVVTVPFLAEPSADGSETDLHLDHRIVARACTQGSGQLVAHVVRGDAMGPTLADGDCVLVDTSARLCPRDGLHLIDSEGGPIVKRLSVNPVTQRIAVLSDNAAYPSYPDCPPDTLRILGRIVWLGRRLP